MSLKEVATEALNNFDPATDSPNSADNVPAGEYDIVIEKAGYVIYDSGYDCVAVTVKIVGGDYNERSELINLNLAPESELGQKYPGIIKKNIKLLIQLCYAVEFELSDDDWEDQITIGQALSAIIGRQCVLTIETGKTKAGKPFRNYEFLRYAV